MTEWRDVTEGLPTENGYYLYGEIDAVGAFVWRQAHYSVLSDGWREGCHGLKPPRCWAEVYPPIDKSIQGFAFHIRSGYQYFIESDNSEYYAVGYIFPIKDGEVDYLSSLAEKFWVRRFLDEYPNATLESVTSELRQMIDKGARKMGARCVSKIESLPEGLWKKLEAANGADWS